MASTARRRTGGGPGGGQWVALCGAVLVILGLTFALGLLVGRQWARHPASAVAAGVAEPAKKPAAAPRRGGIAAETMADRAPESTEKLTFYKTLTEPLDGAGAPPKPEAKPVAIKIPPATPSSQTSPAPPPPPVAAKPAPTPPTASAPSLPPAPAKTADGRAVDGGSANNAAASAPSPNGPATPYTIQVGAYKNRRQADDSRQQLASAGLDAYVVTLAVQEGVARYRVRVGTYRSREEAAAAAERLRAQRSLTTFVTPK
ncbi:MAG TPA: SPOR domain-containing protein [Methylomirabilota bacterium]|nr:SPOR domain-containing protein [Methylomirabilota bacterium]